MQPTIAPARMAAIAASVPASALHSTVAAPDDAQALAEKRLNRLLANVMTASDKPTDGKHITEAARASSQGPNGTVYWTSVVGKLDAAVIILAAELDRLRGHGHKPQRGASLIRLSLGDSEALVEYEYTPGRAGRTYGPPEDCFEEEPEEMTILGALVNGAWVDVDQFAESVVEGWEQSIRDDIQDRRDADMAARAERERDYG